MWKPPKDNSLLSERIEFKFLKLYSNTFATKGQSNRHFRRGLLPRKDPNHDPADKSKTRQRKTREMEARNPKSIEKETKPDQSTVDNRGRLFDNPFKYRSASKQRFARRFSKLPSSLAPTLLPFSPPRLVIYARASFIFTARRSPFPF